MDERRVPLGERLERAAASIDLDRHDLARALDTKPRAVARWLNKETAPHADARERLLELIAVLERLSATLQPTAANQWLFTPNPSLDYHKPVDLLRDGKSRQVLGAIDVMAGGVFV